MKKLIISLLVISFLSIGVGVLAQEATEDATTSTATAAETTQISPGITPDSPFYFLKTWKEKIQTFFTLGAENKAKQFLHLSDVRLAEYQKMVEKGKTEIAQKTLDKYEKQLNNAVQKVQELKDKGKDTKDFTEQIKTTTSKNLQVLQQNLQKVPESAKKGIERAIENAQEQINKGEKGICVNKCGDGICQEIVCLATGCPCPEMKENCPADCQKPEETQINKEIINTKVGETFKITLESNLTTGFQWQVDFDRYYIQWISKQYKGSGEGNSSTPLLGEGGHDTFNFKALKAGETQIKFTYSRPWESVQPGKTIIYKVIIK